MGGLFVIEEPTELSSLPSPPGDELEQELLLIRMNCPH